MEKSYWYSIPNLTAHRYKLNTFRELAKRCMKNTYSILLEIGALEETHLNLIFVDRLSALLPEEYFHRVVSLSPSLVTPRDQQVSHVSALVVLFGAVRHVFHRRVQDTVPVWLGDYQSIQGED